MMSALLYVPKGVTAKAPAPGIVAVQIIPLMVIVATVSSYFFHETGHVYTGAFINAMFITWYIVAGQATHFVV
jgi:uncharacterized protein